MMDQARGVSICWPGDIHILIARKRHWSLSSFVIMSVLLLLKTWQRHYKLIWKRSGQDYPRYIFRVVIILDPMLIMLLARRSRRLQDPWLFRFHVYWLATQDLVARKVWWRGGCSSTQVREKERKGDGGSSGGDCLQHDLDSMTQRIPTTSSVHNITSVFLLMAITCMHLAFGIRFFPTRILIFLPSKSFWHSIDVMRFQM